MPDKSTKIVRVGGGGMRCAASSEGLHMTILLTYAACSVYKRNQFLHYPTVLQEFL